MNYFDKESSVGEIYYDNTQLAEIAYKDDRFILQLYFHPSKKYWEFPLDEALGALFQANERLREKNAYLAETPEQVNEKAKEILEKLINHPGKKTIKAELHRFGKIVDIYAPGAGGARYTEAGEFLGFLEPQWPDKFTITIASLPDRERLVAEVFYNNVQWAEISDETNQILIQFYSYPKQDHWEFFLDEALQVLKAARHKFVELG